MINLHCYSSVVTGTLTTSSSTVNSLLLINGLCLVSQLLLGQGLAEPGDRGGINDFNRPSDKFKRVALVVHQFAVSLPDYS